MFKLECFVKDKDMGEALKRLTGIAHELNHAYVPNIEAKPNGQIRQSAKDTLELLSNELHKQGLKEITGPGFRELVVKLKLNPTSYSHYLQTLVRQGYLKKGKQVGNTMFYNVTGK